MLPGDGYTHGGGEMFVMYVKKAKWKTGNLGKLEYGKIFFLGG